VFGCCGGGVGRGVGAMDDEVIPLNVVHILDAN
jgi:hypothetical protein